MPQTTHCLANMTSNNATSLGSGHEDYDYSFLLANSNGFEPSLQSVSGLASDVALPYGSEPSATINHPWPSSSSQFTDNTQIPQWTKLPEVPDWPDGRQKVTVGWNIAKRSEHSKMKPWHANGWAWEWYGCHWVEKVKGKVTMKKCLGVFNCPDPGRTGCIYVLRPLTKGKLKTQLLSTCPMCHVILRYTECGLRACVIDSKEQQTETWLHFDTHYHDKPTWGRQINRRIHEELTTLVLSNAEATPSQLQRSQSINTAGLKRSALDICPKFTNRSSLRHYKDTILTTANVVSKTAKNTDTFIKQLKSAHKEFPNWILHSSFNDQAQIIVLQSDFMASCMNQMTIATNNQSGYITNAAHGFFEHGLLLNTVGFLPAMGRWMPVLISWIGSNTTECYELHFSYFIKSMKKQVNDLTDDHLSNVIDFSEAESKGFKQAFISNVREAMLEEILALEMQPNDVNLDDQTEAMLSMRARFSTTSLEYRAAACLKGCRFHFEKNLVKVKRNSNFVPIEEAERFAYLVETLLECDVDVYEATLKIIRETFPKTENWLDWWTETRVAEKLFRCKQAMTTTRSAQIPSTTNAVESVHRQIYIACQARSGQRFNVIQGIHALKMYDQTNHTLHENCSIGYKLNYGSAQRSRTMIEQFGTSRPRGRQIALEHINDGRPVDNTQKLLKIQSNAAKADQLAGSSMVDGIRFFPKSNCYQSTPWQNNLCYFDSLVEGFYASYMRDQLYWDELAQSTQDHELDNPELAPVTCFLSLMSARYNNYVEATSVSGLQASLLASRNNSVAGFSMASIIQYGELGSSGDVWNSTVSRFPLNSVTLSPFHGYSISFNLCRMGHNTNPMVQQRCEFVLPFITEEQPGKQKMAEDIILNLLGNGLDIRSLRECAEEDCEEAAIHIKVAVRLPKVFLAEEQSAIKTKQNARYMFPERFIVPCQRKYNQKEPGKARVTTSCQYSMSGKILYQASSQHFTALVRGISKPSVHLYDGMKKNPNSVLCAVEQGMGYCEPVNIGRNSAKLASEILCRTSGQTASALYNLDDHDDAQHQFYLAAVSHLEAIGISLLYDPTEGYSINNLLSLRHQLEEDWSSVPDMNNAEELQFKKRFDLFKITSTDKPMSTQPDACFVPLTSTISGTECASPQEQTYADTDQTHAANRNSLTTTKHMMKSKRKGSYSTESAPELPLCREQEAGKRPKPSYDYVIEPANQLAPKEFKADVNLPPRSVRSRMQHNRNAN